MENQFLTRIDSYGDYMGKQNCKKKRIFSDAFTIMTYMWPQFVHLLLKKLVNFFKMSMFKVDC